MINHQQTTPKFLLLLLLFLMLNSCKPAKDLTYFKDLQDQSQLDTEINNINIPRIQSNDLLGITVSSLNPESNALFNTGALVSPGGTSGATVTQSLEGYLVDQNGNINFPVLGNVKVAGLTKAEATEKLTQEIKKYAKSPIVNIRYLNFKITVLGEVNRPSSYTIPTERINVVEALGLAGDMTVYGKRQNVLVIREKDGKRSTARLDLSQKVAFDSPYFYLQQNDIVYIEPDKARSEQLSNTRSNISLGVSILSLLSIFITRLI